MRRGGERVRRRAGGTPRHDGPRAEAHTARLKQVACTYDTVAERDTPPETANPLHAHESPPKKKYAGESEVRPGNCVAIVVQLASRKDENTIAFLSLGATIHLEVPLPHTSE